MGGVSPERTQRTNEQWIRELRAARDGRGPSGGVLEELRALVLGAARKALRATGAPDDSALEDVTQVALVQVLRQLERFEGRSRFTTWAWAVAVRAALSELRRSAYRRSEGALPDEAEAPASAAPAPEERAEREEIVAVMRRVLETELTERQRAALLGELDGTPRAELAERLGTNPNALAKLLHDARHRLHGHLRLAGIEDDEVREVFDL